MLALACCFLSTCGNKLAKKDYLLQWQSAQIREAFALSSELSGSFVSLGFYDHEDLQTAKDSAEFDAIFNLPQIVQLFVQTYSRMITEYDSGNVSDRISNYQHISSEIRIPANIGCRVISTVKHEGKYHVAIVTIIERDKVTTDLYSGSHKSQRMKDFESKIDKEFLNKLRNIIGVEYEN
jgi:hypothetical protein